ncbi:hypothetical protein HBH98_248340 [Parastagonospora nodorum]|nr:hypothetical protein HBH53_261460 [Parastagonospora nodorum]KAH3956105.1 hypothetical protein HBH51_254770 [Parastagonospora nodorum]KAH4215356.1 hypothetical protein HBI06_255170 [Parastagonospora nodorum]KAH4223032.1 hypothetical protein HBI05_252470 [Parastagonospora nodorum]KAH4333506.1 hypothetical protein HBH98_248340 [Parastagonospora nodorum]
MQTVGGGEDVGEENLHDSAVGAVSTAPLDPPSPRGKKRKRPDATPYDKKPRLQPANIAERRASPSPEEQLRKEEEEQLRKEEEEQLRKDEEEQLRKDEEEQLRKDEEEQLRKEEDQRRKQRRQEDEDQPCGATLPHACADDQRYSNRPTIRKRKRGSSPEPSHGPKKVKAVEVSETLASTQLGRMSQNSAAPAGARQKPSGAPDDNERPSNRSKKGGKRKFSSIQPHKLSPVPKKRVTEGNRLPGPYATLPLEDEMNWEPTKPARKIRKATRRHERLRFAATRSKQGNQGHKLSSLASGLVPPSPPRTMETTMRSDCTAEGTPTVEERGTRVIARELHGGVPYLLVKDDAGLSIIREDECANHAKCNYDREFVPKNHKDELSAIAYKGRDIFKTKVKAVYLVKGHTDLKLNIWYFDLVEKKDRIRCDEKTAIVLMDSLNLCDFDSLSRYLAQTTPARSSHQRPKDRTWDRRQQIRFGETSSQVESSSMNQSQRRASSPASQPGLRATRSPAQRESDRKKDHFADNSNQPLAEIRPR